VTPGGEAAAGGGPLHPMGMAPPRLLPGLVPPPSDWLPCTSWSPRSLSRAVDSASTTASSPRCAAVRVVPLHRLVLAPPLRCGRLCSSDGVFSELQLPSSLLHQVDSSVLAPSPAHCLHVATRPASTRSKRGRLPRTAAADHHSGLLLLLLPATTPEPCKTQRTDSVSEPGATRSPSLAPSKTTTRR
jgi:hypothetical protein